MTNSEKTTFVVGGTDIARDRVEGEILVVGSDGNWRRVGFGILYTGVINASLKSLAQGVEVVEPPSRTQPWLRQKKGRGAQR